MPSGCIEYTGYCDKGGYGTINRRTGADGRPRTQRTHRYVYELVVGPIPIGKHLDHTCQNPPCCNPEHLDPVSPRENLDRVRERRTHCRYGHEFTPENTLKADRWGGRACRECHNRIMRERRARARVVHVGECARCGAEIRGLSTRLYCGNACKVAAWKARQAEVKPPTPAAPRPASGVPEDDNEGEGATRDG